MAEKFKFKILKLITNKVFIDQNKKYSAIIGLNPSNGARSPLLWNKAFNEMNLDIKMHCLDVEKNNFKSLMKLLEQDENFIGGAVTNPYKEMMHKYLKSNIDDESMKIGAINCIYKKKEKLFGTNTDGLGAIYSLKKLGNIKNKKFLILGTGGTSLTVISYLLNYVKKSSDITILGRKKSKISFFKKKFECSGMVLNDFKIDYQNYDFLINCTTVGSINNLNQSLITDYEFKKFKKTLKVFDVIYNPSKTLFLKLATKNSFKTLNGLDMNLLQAVYAFKITNKLPKKYLNKLSSIMNDKKI